jgi:hypothetical protein
MDRKCCPLWADSALRVRRAVRRRPLSEHQPSVWIILPQAFPRPDCLSQDRESVRDDSAGKSLVQRKGRKIPTGLRAFPWKAVTLKPPRRRVNECNRFYAVNYGKAFRIASKGITISRRVDAILAVPSMAYKGSVCQRG